ncbi:MAG: hypothetical protein OEW04_01790 [Nitrospirota bacterium]|nr:hypothetical protein [Nitrospirota bacterium]
MSGTGGHDKIFRLLKVMVAFFPVVFMCYVLYTRFADYAFYQWAFMKEDGPVEWLTFIAYLPASLIALFIAMDLKKENRVYGNLYFILAAGLFVICMEEISWGQRIFGIGTPSFFMSHNRQHEMNMHNMLAGSYVHFLYILTGLYGMLSRVFFRKLFGLKKTTERYLFTPDVFLALYFFMVFAFYFYWDFISPLEKSFWGEYVLRGRFIDAKLQEPAEFIQAAGFLFFLSMNRYRQKKGVFSAAGQLHPLRADASEEKPGAGVIS